MRVLGVEFRVSDKNVFYNRCVARRACPFSSTKNSSRDFKNKEASNHSILHSESMDVPMGPMGSGTPLKNSLHGIIFSKKFLLKTFPKFSRSSNL